MMKNMYCTACAIILLMGSLRSLAGNDKAGDKQKNLNKSSPGRLTRNPYPASTPIQIPGNHPPRKQKNTVSHSYPTPSMTEERSLFAMSSKELVQQQSAWGAVHFQNPPKGNN